MSADNPATAAPPPKKLPPGLKGPPSTSHSANAKTPIGAVKLPPTRPTHVRPLTPPPNETTQPSPQPTAAAAPPQDSTTHSTAAPQTAPVADAVQPPPTDAATPAQQHASEVDPKSDEPAPPATTAAVPPKSHPKLPSKAPPPPQGQPAVVHDHEHKHPPSRVPPPKGHPKAAHAPPPHEAPPSSAEAGVSEQQPTPAAAAPQDTAAAERPSSTTHGSQAVGDRGEAQPSPSAVTPAPAQPQTSSSDQAATAPTREETAAPPSQQPPPVENKDQHAPSSSAPPKTKTPPPPPHKKGPAQHDDATSAPAVPAAGTAKRRPPPPTEGKRPVSPTPAPTAATTSTEHHTTPAPAATTTTTTASTTEQQPPAPAVEPHKTSSTPSNGEVSKLQAAQQPSTADEPSTAPSPSSASQPTPSAAASKQREPSPPSERERRRSGPARDTAGTASADEGHAPQSAPAARSQPKAAEAAAPVPAQQRKPAQGPAARGVVTVAKSSTVVAPSPHRPSETAATQPAQRPPRAATPEAGKPRALHKTNTASSGASSEDEDGRRRRDATSGRTRSAQSRRKAETPSSATAHGGALTAEQAASRPMWSYRRSGWGGGGSSDEGWTSDRERQRRHHAPPPAPSAPSSHRGSKPASRSGTPTATHQQPPAVQRSAANVASLTLPPRVSITVVVLPPPPTAATAEGPSRAAWHRVARTLKVDIDGSTAASLTATQIKRAIANTAIDQGDYFPIERQRLLHNGVELPSAGSQTIDPALTPGYIIAQHFGVTVKEAARTGAEVEPLVFFVMPRAAASSNATSALNTPREHMNPISTLNAAASGAAVRHAPDPAILAVSDCSPVPQQQQHQSASSPPPHARGTTASRALEVGNASLRTIGSPSSSVVVVHRGAAATKGYESDDFNEAEYLASESDNAVQLERRLVLDSPNRRAAGRVSVVQPTIVTSDGLMVDTDQGSRDRDHSPRLSRAGPTAVRHPVPAAPLQHGYLHPASAAVTVSYRDVSSRRSVASLNFNSIRPSEEPHHAAASRSRPHYDPRATSEATSITFRSATPVGGSSSRLNSVENATSHGAPMRPPLHPFGSSTNTTPVHSPVRGQLHNTVDPLTETFASAVERRLSDATKALWIAQRRRDDLVNNAAAQPESATAIARLNQDLERLEALVARDSELLSRVRGSSASKQTSRANSADALAIDDLLDTYVNEAAPRGAVHSSPVRDPGVQRAIELSPPTPGYLAQPHHRPSLQQPQYNVRPAVSTSHDPVSAAARAPFANYSSAPPPSMTWSNWRSPSGGVAPDVLSQVLQGDERAAMRRATLPPRKSAPSANIY